MLAVLGLYLIFLMILRGTLHRGLTELETVEKENRPCGRQSCTYLIDASSDVTYYIKKRRKKKDSSE